jgi:hypothetical protein
MKPLIYFGQEKPLVNITSYGMFEKIIHKKFIVLMPENFSIKFIWINKKITFKKLSTIEDQTAFFDYLLLYNYFTRRNKSLNKYLRVSFLGTSKIYNLKSFVLAFKNVIKKFTSINLFVLCKFYKKDSVQILKILRSYRIIRSNDTNSFLEILKSLEIDKVFILTTFSDITIYDLIDACNQISIPVYVLPESWDNISTSISIPSNLTELLVWSNQQLKEVSEFYPELISKTKIIGSYRITNAVSQREFTNTKSITQPVLKTKFKIVYLEGYFLEDVNHILNTVLDVMPQIKRLDLSFVEIIYRRYPLNKQTSEKIWSTKLDINSRQFVVNFRISERGSLMKDLTDVDLVISESTTAGLEAAFCLKPVLFVYSKKSRKYIDTKRSYDFSYSRDLKKYFNVVDFDSLDCKKNLKAVILNSCFKTENEYESKKLSILLEYFGEPFNFKVWEMYNLGNV